MKAFFEKSFFRDVLKLGLPIALHQFLIQSLKLSDSLMVGQLGGAQITAVANGAQVAYFLYLISIGVGAAASMFVSQFHGKGERRGVRQTLALSVCVSVVVSAVFFTASFFFPEWVMRLLTNDADVIDYGVQYLRIDSFSYFFYGLSLVYSYVLKGIKKPRIPLCVSLMTVTIKITVSYLLIFGKLGLPALGVRGAAIGTIAALGVEAITLIVICQRRMEVRLRRRNFLFRNGAFVLQYLKFGSPTILYETIWGIGNFSFVLLYNRLGDTAATAMSIFFSLEKMFNVVFMGIAQSASIMTGSSMGGGKDRQAYAFGRQFFAFAPMLAFALAVLVFALRFMIVSWYNVTPEEGQTLANVLTVFAVGMPFLMVNMVTYLGTFRGGGDVRLTVVVDLLAMYLIGLPAAYLTGMVWKLPVYWVYAAFILLPEMLKAVYAFFRLRSKKWMHNLVKQDDLIKDVK